MAVELITHSLFSDANLQAYWRFEGNGNDSKNSNTLTATNISYGNEYGRFTQGANLGLTSKLQASGSIINGNSAMTVMGWYYASSNSTLQFLFTKMLDQGNPGLFFANNSGTLRLVYRAASDTGFNGASINLNAWQHVAFTQSAGGTVNLYQNGVDTGGGSVTLFANTNVVVLGKSNTDNSFGVVGNLDEWAMFNRELSAQEIADYYNFSRDGGSPIFFGNTAIA